MSAEKAGYVRPGWTGEPGEIAPMDWDQCPSCLGYHAVQNVACNGLREPCDRQCESFMGEVQCHRPANHIGRHEAKSSTLKLTWELLA